MKRPYIQHGDTGTRLYRIWKGMKCRCLNQNYPSYKDYGARGIRICPEWVEDYPCFKEWALAHGYREELELDRIDVNGDYEPSNCRWTTHHAQTLNRRDSLFVLDGRRRVPIADFLREANIPKGTFVSWRHKGVENESMSRRIGRKVVVVGGKTNH